MTANTAATNATTKPAEPTIGEKASATYAAAKDSVADAAVRSKDAVAGAAKSTAETVKANPGATAAIVAGAAAAIAGAAFGASKLIEKKKQADATPKKVPATPKAPASK